MSKKMKRNNIVAKHVLFNWHSCRNQAYLKIKLLHHTAITTSENKMSRKQTRAKLAWNILEQLLLKNPESQQRCVSLDEGLSRAVTSCHGWVPKTPKTYQKFNDIRANDVNFLAHSKTSCHGLSRAVTGKPLSVKYL